MNSHAHRTAALSLLALGALVLQLPLHAQIKADPSAPGNQRPTLLQTANGVPQVNIQTPSPAGVSRNSYSQFDVDGRGVVLNNSRNNVQTRLGGLVSGNPWIARPARVILNEVNSSSPSYLRGYVEVAGQRAEVVIANPAGIQVSGGGFINASGVTLTTGTPVMNGGDLESFRVQRGQVTIDGTGLDTSTADYTRILARALQVNAGLWAKDLTALTGASEVKALAAGTAATATSMAGTGPAPTFTLDVAALGGMYAGKIFLVGTEAGLGVNNRGILAAQEGDLVLRADGWLVNTGSVYARGNTAIAVTGDVTNAGASLIGAWQDTTINARQVSSDSTAVLASGLAQDGSLGSSGNLSITATQQTAVHGKTLAAGDLSVRGSSLDLAGMKASAGNVTLVASAGPLKLQGAAVGTPGLLSVDAAGAVTADNAWLRGNQLALRAQSLSNSGGELSQTGAGTLSIATTGALDNTGGLIVGKGALGISTGALTNLRGSIQATGDATIDTHGQALDNTAGRLTSRAALTLGTGALTNGVAADQAGFIGSNGALTLTTGALDNQGNSTNRSTLWSGDALRVGAANLTNAGILSAKAVEIHQVGDLTNLATGSLESTNDLRVTASGAFANAGSVIANRTLTVHARDITNTGTLDATDQTLTADRTLTNTASGELTAARTVVIDAVTVNNQGVINANDAAGASELVIRATTVNNSGTGALFGDRVAIAATTLNNRPQAGSAAAPVIAARTRLDLGVQTLNNEDGALIYSGGSMGIGGRLDAARASTDQSLAINNLSAIIEADTNLSINTATLRNERRNVNIQQVTSIDETVDMQLAAWQGNSFQARPISAGGFNYRAWQTYYLDPASILSVEEFVTPDGLRIGKAKVQLTTHDSLFYLAVGASGYYPIGQRARQVIAQAETRVIYFIGRQDGVSNPDQVAGGLAPEYGVVSPAEWELDTISYSTAYGRCTTNCVRLITPLDYTDPVHTIYNRRNHPSSASENELSRTAHHTATDDLLNPDAGAPARISAGGAMQLTVRDGLSNRHADILAGASLALDAATAAVTNEGQTLYRVHAFNNTTHTYSGSSYDWTSPAISEVIGQAGGTISGNRSVSIAARNLANTDLAKSSGVPTTGLNFLGVNLPTGSAPVTVPASSLFHPAGVTANYLVESDPRFTSDRQWLGSDYMLSSLATDPATVQKRLGDGFYEQRLIREQVGQLTGRRFLNGYANDEAQYRALMDAGLTYAKEWKLIPGVALSAEQMANLTTDLVWLVEREVVMPDGSHTKALVPQVYVRRAREGDITPAGAMIAGNDVSLDIAGDLVNNGGTLAGNNLTASAGRDIVNIGGLMQARTTLVASAGRDVIVASPTVSSSFGGSVVTQSRTELAGVGSIRVTGGAGGALRINAGRNVDLQAAAIANSSAGSQTVIAAGNDINLTTVRTGSSEASVFDAGNYITARSTLETGTAIQTQGSLTLSAGNNLTARAASVNAAGALTAQAGNDITLEAGRATRDTSVGTHSSSSGLFSKRSSTTRQSSSSDTAIGSSFGGDTVTLVAGQDLTVKGSAIVSDKGTTLAAGNDVAIVADENRSGSTFFSEQKKSGVFSGGGLGITIGKQQQTGTQSTSRTTAAASTVGAISGDVNIVAGQTYQQAGSDVLAPAGDITIAAKDVQITEAREISTSTTEQKFKQSGITVAITSPVISAIQTAQAMAQAASDTGDDRMKLLAAANVGFAANNALNAVKAGQGVDALGKSGQIVTKTDDKGNPIESRDANAADKVGGIDVSVSIGRSKSSSTTTQTSDTARGSNVAAGGNVNIQATGAGAASDLVIRGSEVTAGNNATLKAAGEINLTAAQNTASLSGSNKSSSASIGITFGTSGFGVTASGSAGRGNQAGDDVIQSNTRVTAGNTATVQSGADTTVAGAVVQADTVKANVGGNLNITSLQDTSTYDSKQQNIGASVTFGANPGGSFNAAKSNIDSTYQSVTETSGIKSGGGGFQVSVGNNTDLKGGVIASNQSAVDNNKNSFTTGGQLTTSDIQNSANYSASSSSVSVGTGLPAQNLGISGVGVGAGSDSGQASSTTQAGISGFAGNTAVRSTDAETGIAKIFDQDKVRKEIDAQVKITETFGRNASKAVGDWAATQMKQATSLRDQARDETDPAKQADLLAQADQLEANWGDSGTLRVAAHTVIGGLTGGASGAAGALTGTLAAPAIADALNKAGITGPLASTLTGLGSTLIGAAAGGTPGGAAALNEVANNYLNHKQWSDLANKLKACKTQAECEQVTKEFVTLSAQQDAEMRLACQDTSSVACRGHISSALSGSYTQMELVAAGILPVNYAAGANLNAQANLLARNVIVADIKAACLADAACRQKQDNINGVVLLGTIGLVTAPMLPSLGSAAVAWIVANPVTAQMLGIISAETAMALATGAVSPNSIAEGLFALGAASTIKFVGGTAAGRNFVGGTTIKTLAEAADSVTAQSAAQAQKLNQELSTLAKVQPDTARDAFYLANTDQTILKANNFDMNHVLSGEINNAGRATGYHAELAAEGAARIRPGSAVTQNANGTYTAQVDVFDAAKGIWVEKVTNKGQSTFFNPSWSQARIEYEVAEAFKRGQTANPGQKSFTEFTPSGLQIQFHSDGNRTTFFPTGR